jgi:membrane associated rhomboid family serine protease
MRNDVVTMGLPRPGKALLAVMGVLLAIWVMFAVGINYGGLPESAFLFLVGSTDAVLHGQVWRLFTAGLMHLPSGDHAVSHIVSVLLGLYFLAPTLEARWGGTRMIFFLLVSCVMGYLFQLAAEAITGRALGMGLWFGAMPAVEAIAVAWALSYRGQMVSLFFVLPVTGTGLLVFVIGVSVLYVLAAGKPPSGLISPFGGMFAGYLFGAGNPTPARRLLLKLRYVWIARRAEKYRGKRKVAASHLRVIEGGEPEERRKPPTDKRFLN